MLGKALITAIIGGVLFPLFFKLFTRKSLDKKTTSPVIQGFFFAVIFFMILIVTKTFS
ncbi:hypothetical protein Q3A90_10320 [Priestia megaterium]|uniref:hypothetical protein n=1 Tax=Priestia TaxID=2800373 RepID=UPI001CFCB872|nr:MULTISPECIES: hypothetical protein [Priestia]WKU25229.1 hypothetical protein Q3A90_10320 [Priestia megaterium]